MAKYDTERFLEDIKAILTSKLNAKFLEIDTEKADTITLKPVGSTSYFLQGLNERAANLDPFVVYGYEPGDTKSIGSSSAQDILVSVVIVVSDHGSDLMNTQMLRYARALKEVFEENWQMVEFSTKLRINELEPINLKLDADGDNQYKAVGIQILTNLA